MQFDLPSRAHRLNCSGCEARYPRDRRRGFTLIEVFIVLAIVSIGVLATLSAQITALKSGQTGRHLTQASVLARDRLESLHRLDWTDPGLADTTASVGPPAGYIASFVVNHTVQSTVLQIEQVYNVQDRIVNTGATLKAMSVRVTWTEADGRNRSHVVSSVRHDDP